MVHLDPPLKLATEKIGNIYLVYEALGVAQVSFDVMSVLGMNGVFVFTGIPAPEGHITLAGNQLMRNLVLKNQLVVGTVNADKAAFQAAIRDLGEFKKRWPKALAQIITARHPITDYRDLLIGKSSGIKHVIAFKK